MVCLIPALVLGLLTSAAAPAGHAPGPPRDADARQQRTATAPAQLSVPTAPLKQVRVNGARYFTESRIVELLHLRQGAPLPQPVDSLAEDLRDRYAQQGYAFARVQARFDAQDGRLMFDIDEGRIDAVEFVGVPGPTAAEFRENFALQPGDVFRVPEAGRALRLLLRPTQGAVQPDQSGTGAGTPSGQVRRPFEMIDRDGRHVLVVHLSAPRSDFNLSAGADGREDWFNPVDGFSPVIGFNETIFDERRFNHTYITGYASYKFGRDRGGYSIGFERPFLPDQRLFLGAEVHDQTASDDLWRLSVTEQSLAAAGFKATFRDYYARRGYQLNASLRLGASQEVLGAWRDERQAPLANTTDFSVFRNERAYRPNQAAEPGRLHALVFGYTFDSRGLAEETRSARYERHQMADLFGTWGGGDPGWRVEASAEIAAPGLGGDFDYRRFVVNVRRYSRLAPHHALNLRAVAGIGEGQIPPQRLFAIGGVGSVPGYDFKTMAGERMVLLDAEYQYRLVRGLHPLLTYDAGRVSQVAAAPPRDRWVHSVGAGLEFGGSLRVQIFWPLNGDHPAEFLIRLRPAF